MDDGRLRELVALWRASADGQDELRERAKSAPVKACASGAAAAFRSCADLLEKSLEEESEGARRKALDRILASTVQSLVRERLPPSGVWSP